MFFDDVTQIPKLAASTGFSLFILQKSITIDFPTTSTFKIEPANGKIRIDQIREIGDYAKIKQNRDHFIVVEHAETMTEGAQNAFLKLLEEPSENYHFVLLVNQNTGKILPTIFSRAKIYFLKENLPLKQPVAADEETKNLARSLISATPAQLITLAERLADKKAYKNPRENALNVTATAIEILYKSYFATKNPKFLKTLPKFLKLYENLSGNGHIKLHLVADLC